MKHLILYSTNKFPKACAICCKSLVFLAYKEFYMMTKFNTIIFMYDYSTKFRLTKIFKLKIRLRIQTTNKRRLAQQNNFYEV